MKKTWKSPLFALLILAGGIFYACSKNDSSAENNLPPGKQNVSIYLSDDPGFFDQVLVDIKSVKVLVDTCAPKNRHHDDFDHHDGDEHNKKDTCAVWDSLNLRPGVYDLLTLRNGADTLLAGGNIPAGNILLIKIELGTNNSLVKDSVHYPLQLAPGTANTIVITLRGDEWDEFRPGHLQLWLDFDVTRSIIKVRDGVFFLRPFIKIFTEKVTGSLQGIVSPRDAFPVISAYNNTDTAYALPNSDGNFKIRGLLNGNYTVFVNASNGYKDTTLTNVSISMGKATNLGKITLHK